MRLNLTACGERFTSGEYPHYTYNYPDYVYNGPIRGILRNLDPKPPLITVQGCKDLCGQGADYYPWKDVSSTITTWVRFRSYSVQLQYTKMIMPGTTGHRSPSASSSREQCELA